MNRRLILVAIIVTAFPLSYWGHRCLQPATVADAARGVHHAARYDRIVSLAPSITEVLFQLGLDDRVVGVTRYCQYPPAASEKASVGNYLSPNYEAIVALRPDLVVTLPEHAAEEEALTALGLHWHRVDHRSVAGIVVSMRDIGQLTDVSERAQASVDDPKRRMARVRRLTQGRPQPQTLVSTGRKMGTGSLKDAYVAGPGSFYDSLLHLAGGENVFAHAPLAYPSVTAEGIMRLDPDVIIDMVAGIEKKGIDRDSVLAEWQVLPNVKAVKNQRVHVFAEAYVSVPGPRFILLLEAMARVLHPEVAWD